MILFTVFTVLYICKSIQNLSNVQHRSLSVTCLDENHVVAGLTSCKDLKYVVCTCLCYQAAFWVLHKLGHRQQVPDLGIHPMLT